MRAGEVTKALHNLSEGDKVGVRAPMGCGFPLEAWKGKSIRLTVEFRREDDALIAESIDA